MPVVEDTKNALLVKFDPAIELDKARMATLQHALIRAIETEHVLETGELLGEALPTRDNRKAILLYEASEGGAGVLKRLMDGPGRWRRLAEVALDLMHYRRRGDDLSDRDDACVAGCYRCLLSYYNQPDHELIDRRDKAVLETLRHLAACERDRPADRSQGAGGDAWLDALARWGAPLPSSETIAGIVYPLCWPGHMVMATAGPPPGLLEARCFELGRELIELAGQPGETIPLALADALGVT